ncbi:hypothetical protein PPROV_000503700 [Pycnococcus provasolii]|uniref:Protein kinase domain-containing protein n=1 Tax=Pycnococcus provasolii TaxID=41880 RepID=A0A830HKF3_9CHLO|nr:hypothetical protein PPROV_000503700 [Pycnococcus provasolii]
MGACVSSDAGAAAPPEERSAAAPRPSGGAAASKAPASQGAAKDPKRNVRALYDFGEMLGKGGFAEVRLATEKATGKQVAMIAQERIKALMGNVAQGYERSKSIVENPDDMSKARAAADHYVEFSKAAQQE